MPQEPSTNDQFEPCRCCGTALAHDQRYCLNCGVRRATQRVPSGPVLAALAVAAAGAAQFGGTPPMALAHSASEGKSALTGANALATAFATKPAASAGLALLAVGAIIGSAFGPPVSDTLASGQRVVIVQAAGAQATGPAAEPAVADTPVADVPPAIPTVVTPPPAVTPTPVEPPTPPANPSIGHVMVVLLPGGAPGQALPASLVKKGFLLKGYRQPSVSGLANRLALITGQAPNAATSNPTGCDTPSPVPEPPSNFMTGNTVTGDGCIYPRGVGDIASDVAGAAGEKTRIYLETGATKPTSGWPDDSGLCTPPADGVALTPPTAGAPDPRDNPFLWLTKFATGFDCAQEIRPLERLADDIKADHANKAVCEQASSLDDRTACLPPVTFIIPSRCRGLVAVKCPDGTTDGGPAALNAFLSSSVSGVLMKSSPYTSGGMVALGFDQPASGDTADTPTGLLLLSPLVKSGKSSNASYAPYDLLLTIEAELGYGSIKDPSSNLGPFLGRSNPEASLGYRPVLFPSTFFTKKLDPRPVTVP
ncbi:MAG: hypothetical protein F2799_03030 [Actinobacteria bacterium]|uniref:Unannotated protein n=1 Tax=freshwater metagenome TaxID=449393 RepID=A0A6J7DCR2_9ZZZZ|nr:hypothetical protein [Actinomycetota bacterium]